MTAHTNNPRPEQRHAADPYAEFYDDDAAETAAWLNGAEWARDPEQIEADNATRVPPCQCGEMHLCPGCLSCMGCEAGFGDCESPEPHCGGGCWTDCSFCTADRKSGTR